tara:strand:- start:946 stop:5715 length:4770 start_codon:yes stop_codon:yes gene_type:complete
MAISGRNKVPDNYKEPEEEKEEEEEGPSVTDDLLRIQAGMERGVGDLVSFAGDVYNYVTEDTPLPEEQVRNERANKLRETANRFRQSGAGGLLNYLTAYAQEKYADDIFDETGKVKDVETTTGQIAQIGSYVVPGIGAYKVLPRAIPTVGRAIIAEQAVEQTLTSPGENLINAFEEVFPEQAKNEFVDFLAADPDDNEAELRFKTSLVSLGLGAVIGTTFEAGKLTARGIIKGTAFGADALKNLRRKSKGFRKDVDELSEEQVADVIVESVKIAREQAAKQKIELERGSSIYGERAAYERVGPNKKPYPKQDEPTALPKEKELTMETVEGRTQVEKQNINVFTKVKQKVFTPRGYFTEKGKRFFDDSFQNQKADIQAATDISLRIKRSVDKLGKLSSEAQEKMTDKIQQAFESDVGKNFYELPRSERAEFFRMKFGLTEEIAEGLADSRQLIDTLSRKLYNSHFVDKETRATIESNIGRYFRRSYRAWEDPGYKPNPEIKTEAIEYKYEQRLKEPEVIAKMDSLREEDPSGELLEAYLARQREGAAGEVEQYLTYVKDKEVVDFVAQMRGAAKLHQREEQPEVIRKLLGEIKDPLENIVLSISKASRIYNQNNYYENLRKLGRNGGWIGNKSELRTERITGTNNFALDGMEDDPRTWTYTTPEMLRAMRNQQAVPEMIQNEGAMGQLMRTWAGAKGRTQELKTVWNHVTHIRNAAGAMQITLANGINPFVRDGSEPFKVLADNVLKGGDKELKETYEKFIRLGIVDTNVRINEFRELISTGFEAESNDILNKKILQNKNLQNLLKPLDAPTKGIRNVGGTIPQIYRATDDYAKINAYTYELKTLKAARPNEAIEVLEQEAAEIVKNTLPNYNRVPPGIKILRYAPVSNFTGFASESIRITNNILHRGFKEITSGNEELTKRGMQRLTGFATVGASGFTLASKASEVAMGWTEEEARAYNTLAEGKYYKDSHKIWSRDKNGVPQFIDTRGIDAFNVIRDPFVVVSNRIAAGDFSGERELTEALKDTTLQVLTNFLAPYAEPTMVAETFSQLGAAVAAEDGRDFDGKQLFRPANTFGDNIEIMSGRMFELIQPGALPNLQKLNDALNGKIDPYSNKQKRDVDVEVQANLLGYRQNISDKDVHTYNLAETIKNYKTRSENNYMRGLNLESTPEEVSKDYLRVQKEEREYQKDLYEVAKAYATLWDKDSGIYGDMNTIEVLRQNGISKAMSVNLMGGMFTPDAVNKIVIKEQQDRINMQVSPEFADYKKYQDSFDLFDNNLRHESLERFRGNAFTIDGQEDIFQERIERIRQSKDKGGIVENVPSVPEEPDQRIDKMTGLPYDQQAGTAFVDQEDPLRRMGFNTGSQVTGDPLQNLGFGGTYYPTAQDEIAGAAREEANQARRAVGVGASRSGSLTGMPQSTLVRDLNSMAMQTVDEAVNTAQTIINALPEEAKERVFQEGQRQIDLGKQRAAEDEAVRTGKLKKAAGKVGQVAKQAIASNPYVSGVQDIRAQETLKGKAKVGANVALDQVPYVSEARDIISNIRQADTRREKAKAGVKGIIGAVPQVKMAKRVLNVGKFLKNKVKERRERRN